MYAPRVGPTVMSLFPLDKSIARNLAEQGKTIREAVQYPTLVNNLRAQPLTFALACLGLLTVLAAKVLVMRSRAREDAASAGR